MEEIKTKDNTSFIINETVRANSKEFGKAGNRFKLYFNNAIDLEGQIKDLKDKGLWIDEEQTQIFYKMKGGIKNMEETEKTDVEAPVEEVAEEVVEEAKEEEVEEEATAEAETEADQI